MHWRQAVWLREYFLYHVAVDVGQAKIATRVVEGKLLVVQAQEMQHGGVPIVDICIKETVESN